MSNKNILTSTAHAVIQYLAMKNKPVIELYNIWNFGWPSYVSSSRHPFRIQRIRSAINLAVAATAMRLLYGEYYY